MLPWTAWQATDRPTEPSLNTQSHVSHDDPSEGGDAGVSQDDGCRTCTCVYDIQGHDRISYRKNYTLMLYLNHGIKCRLVEALRARLTWADSVQQ